jgi:hypothetical protein
MAEDPLGYYTMFGPGESTDSAIAPELVEDPSFSGGFAFESYDPFTLDPSGRHAVDWGSLKTVDYSIEPPSYRRGAVMLSEFGEIYENKGDFDTPYWEIVGSIYDSGIWSDPGATGGSLSGSLPTYAPPSTSLFPSAPLPSGVMLGAGMYATLDPSAILPAAPDPVYHSVITGTFDPTPAEIIAAAAAAGSPIPSGVDPVEFSRMMSGLPPIPMSASFPSAPLPSGLPPSSSIPTSSSPLGLLTPMPASPTSGTSLPASMPPSSSFPLPTGGAVGGVSGSPFTTAMKTLSFDGGGGILCDPITGKCPQYR